jgi:hypothetical protein
MCHLSHQKSTPISVGKSPHEKSKDGNLGFAGRVAKGIAWLSAKGSRQVMAEPHFRRIEISVRHGKPPLVRSCGSTCNAIHSFRQDKEKACCLRIVEPPVHDYIQLDFRARNFAGRLEKP